MASQKAKELRNLEFKLVEQQFNKYNDVEILKVDKHGKAIATRITPKKQIRKG